MHDAVTILDVVYHIQIIILLAQLRTSTLYPLLNRTPPLPVTSKWAVNTGSCGRPLQPVQSTPRGAGVPTVPSPTPEQVGRQHSLVYRHQPQNRQVVYHHQPQNRWVGNIAQCTVTNPRTGGQATQPSVLSPTPEQVGRQHGHVKHRSYDTYIDPTVSIGKMLYNQISTKRTE